MIVGIVRLIRVIIQLLADFGSMMWLFRRPGRTVVSDRVVSRPLLGGLHHEYNLALHAM